MDQEPGALLGEAAAADAESRFAVVHHALVLRKDGGVEDWPLGFQLGKKRAGQGVVCNIRSPRGKLKKNFQFGSRGRLGPT